MFGSYCFRRYVITELSNPPDKQVAIGTSDNNLFFTAHGVNNQIDPYYEHTYKVSLNGGVPKLLNKGNFNTMTYPSDNHRYFVNNFSRDIFH